MENDANKIMVHGLQVDNQTRCVHYHSPLDIIAIKFKCCQKYYACIHCHLETSNHPVIVWKKAAFDTKAILCGNCSNEMTIAEYIQSNSQCKFCKAPFNPKCSSHYPFYFEID